MGREMKNQPKAKPGRIVFVVGGSKKERLAAALRGAENDHNSTLFLTLNESADEAARRYRIDRTYKRRVVVDDAAPRPAESLANLLRLYGRLGVRRVALDGLESMRVRRPEKAARELVRHLLPVVLEEGLLLHVLAESAPKGLGGWAADRLLEEVGRETSETVDRRALSLHDVRRRREAWEENDLFSSPSQEVSGKISEEPTPREDPAQLELFC